jgi:hypothetical protein
MVFQSETEARILAAMQKLVEQRIFSGHQDMIEKAKEKLGNDNIPWLHKMLWSVAQPGQTKEANADFCRV